MDRQIILEDLNGVAALKPLALIFHLQALGAVSEVDSYLSLHEKRNDEPVDVIPDITRAEQLVELGGKRHRGLLAGCQVAGKGFFQPELDLVG